MPDGLNLTAEHRRLNERKRERMMRLMREAAGALRALADEGRATGDLIVLREASELEKAVKEMRCFWVDEDDAP